MKRIRWALLAACATLIANATQAGLLVSEKEVRREARVQWLDLKRHLSVEPDVRMRNYVQCVADHVIATLPPEQAKLDWEVVLFDDDSNINAFSDPNSKIAVFTGILKVADTPDALAAVLGHEVAHVTEHHVMDMAKRGARSDALVLLGAAVTGVSFQDGAQLGLVLPYARKQETEADEVGLQYMAKAGFDPRAALYLWKNMAVATEGKNKPPEFLSTHPADDVRLDTIVKMITPALIEYNVAREAGKRPNCQSPIGNR